MTVIIVNLVWTIVVIVAFALGNRDGRKRRQGRELTCYTCGDQFVFPSTMAFREVEQFMILHYEWHAQRVTE